MPLTVTGSIRSLARFSRSSLGGPHWVSVFGQTSASGIYGQTGIASTLDTSTGELVVAGSDYSLSGYFPVTGYHSIYFKLSGTGSLTSQQRGTSSYQEQTRQFTKGSSGAYVGSSQDTGSPFRSILYSFTSSFEPNWEQRITGPTGGASVMESKILSDGKVLNVGKIGVTGSPNYYDNAYLIKIAVSNAGVYWKKVLGENTDSFFGSVVVDNDNYIYAAGSETTDTNNFYGRAIIAKYDVDGNLIWQKGLSASSTNFYELYSMKYSPSDNSLVGLVYDDQNYSQILVVKLDTSGNILWQKRLTGVGSGKSTAVDNAGNIYVLCPSTGHIVKFDLNGNVLWQRVANTGYNSYGSLNLYSNTDLSLVLHKSFGSVECVIWRLPSDGSKTGSYSVSSTTVTYMPSAITFTAGNLTAVTTTLTEPTANLVFLTTVTNRTLSTSTTAYTKKDIS